MAAACNPSVSIHMCVCMYVCTVCMCTGNTPSGYSTQSIGRVNQKASKNPVCVVKDHRQLLFVYDVYTVHTSPIVELTLARPLPGTHNIHSHTTHTHTNTFVVYLGFFLK